MDRLNCLLAEGGIWSHGAISGVGQEQIGQEFGLSGTTYRLFVTTESRDDATLIAKFEPVDNIRRRMVGWAGLVEEEPAEGRKLALRGDSVGRVLAAIRWLDR